MTSAFFFNNIGNIDSMIFPLLLLSKRYARSCDYSGLYICLFVGACEVGGVNRGLFNIDITSVNAVPVSYTHLDVYKRQMQMGKEDAADIFGPKSCLLEDLCRMLIFNVILSAGLPSCDLVIRIVSTIHQENTRRAGNDADDVFYGSGAGHFMVAGIDHGIGEGGAIGIFY